MISVVIPTWNRFDLLRENLPSVTAAVRFYERSHGPSEIIVVDDGGDDETSEALPREFPGIRLVRRSRNGGFAAACNSGFQECRHPVVALLNNDVQIDEDYLVHLAAHFEDADVFAVTARVFEWDSPVFATGGKVGRFRKGFWSVYFNYDLRAPQDSRWDRRLASFYAVGGFAAYDRGKLEDLGGFLELLSPFHWEDIDLSYRGWKRGWEVRYEPRSRARHRTSATIGARFRARQVERAATRNRLLFHWVNIHRPGWLCRHLGMLSLLLLTRVWVGDWTFYQAFGGAVRRLPSALRQRRIEKAKRVRDDAEVARLLNEFMSQAPVDVYESRGEVLRRHPESIESSKEIPSHAS